MESKGEALPVTASSASSSIQESKGETKQTQRTPDRAKRGLDGELKRMQPLVMEANQIAEDLMQPVVLSVKVLASKLVASPSSRGAVGEPGGASVGILLEGREGAAGADGQARVYWNVDKFLARLETMREQHAAFVEDAGRELGAWQMLRDEAKWQNPFVDPPQPLLVGSAMVMLHGLNYILDIEQTTPLIDLTGHVQGALRVRIKPAVSLGPDSWLDPDEAVDNEPLLEHYMGRPLRVTLEVVSVSGLPQDVTKDIHVRFGWYGTEEPCETERVHARGGTAKVGHVKTFQHTIHRDIIDYLQQDILQLEVYGLSTAIVDGARVITNASRTLRRGTSMKNVSALDIAAAEGDGRGGTGVTFALQAPPTPAKLGSHVDVDLEELAALRARTKDLEAEAAKKAEEVQALQSKLMEAQERPPVTKLAAGKGGDGGGGGDGEEEAVPKSAYDQVLRDTKLIKEQLRGELSHLQEQTTSLGTENEELREATRRQQDEAAAQLADAVAAQRREAEQLLAAREADAKEQSSKVEALTKELKAEQAQLDQLKKQQKKYVPESDLKSAKDRIAQLQNELEAAKKKKSGGGCSIL